MLLKETARGRASEAPDNFQCWLVSLLLQFSAGHSVCCIYNLAVIRVILIGGRLMRLRSRSRVPVLFHCDNKTPAVHVLRPCIGREDMGVACDSCREKKYFVQQRLQKHKSPSVCVIHLRPFRFFALFVFCLLSGRDKQTPACPSTRPTR